METLNATTARKNFFKLMDSAVKTHEPIVITGKSGNVVMMPEEDYRSMQETLYLTSIPGTREKIMKGMETPIKELVEDTDI